MQPVVASGIHCTYDVRATASPDAANPSLYPISGSVYHDANETGFRLVLSVCIVTPKNPVGIRRPARARIGSQEFGVTTCTVDTHGYELVEPEGTRRNGSSVQFRYVVRAVVAG